MNIIPKYTELPQQNLYLDAIRTPPSKDDVEKIQKELEVTNKKYDDLLGKHKHDTLKAILLTILGAISGVGLTILAVTLGLL